MGEITKIKNEAPAVYWRAVDMARDGKSAAYIRREIAWMLEAENERRAIRGMETIAVSI